MREKKEKEPFLQRQEKRTKALDEKYSFNIVTITSAIVMGIAMFLPYINVDYMGMQKYVAIYKKIDGMTFFTMAIFIILIAMLKKRILCFFMGVACFAGSILEPLVLFYRVRKHWDLLPKEAQSYGYGVLIFIFAGIGLLIGGIIMLLEEIDERRLKKADMWENGLTNFSEDTKEYNEEKD